MRKLPELSEMEHITSKEFGDHMDAILDRIVEEDIALVIDDNGKFFVICPASWFELAEPKHLDLMVKNAVRFVAAVDDADLAETVEMVSDVAPALSPECIRSLLTLIKGKGVGDCKGEWKELRQVLEAVLPTADNKEKDSDGNGDN